MFFDLLGLQGRSPVGDSRFTGTSICPGLLKKGSFGTHTDRRGHASNRKPNKLL